MFDNPSLIISIIIQIVSVGFFVTALKTQISVLQIEVQHLRTQLADMFKSVDAKINDRVSQRTELCLQKHAK